MGTKTGNIRNLWLLISAVLIFSLSMALGKFSFYSFSEKRTVRNFENSLQEKEQYLLSVFDRMNHLPQSCPSQQLFYDCRERIPSDFSGSGLSIFVFRNDSLLYWSDNTVASSELTGEESAKGDFVLLGSSWFVRKERQSGSIRIVGLILVKKQYVYQNRFLSNDFQPDFRLPPGTVISSLLDNKELVIRDSWENELFSLDFSEIPKYSQLQVKLSLIFFFAGILLFLLFIRHLIKSIPEPSMKNLGIAMGGLILILVKAVLLKMPIPDQLSSFELFRPELYAASNWFPSLGDLLITALFAFFLAFIFYAEFSLPRNFRLKYKGWYYGLQVFLTILIILYFHFISLIFRSLVLNSSISFEMYRVPDLTIYTFIGLLIIAMHYAAYAVIVDKYFSLYRYSGKTRFLGIILLIFGLGLWLLGLTNPAGSSVWLILAIIVITGIMATVRTNPGIQYKYSSLVLLILLFSLLTVFQIEVNTGEKRKSEKMVLAVDLSAEHDPVAEQLLREMEEDIATDPFLKSILQDNYVDEISLYDHLVSKYFSGFFNKYNLQFTFCSPYDSLYIEPYTDFWYPCYDFFEGLKRRDDIKIPGSRFYFIDNRNGQISYLASFNYFSEDSLDEISLFLELDSRLIAEELGYPELLLTERLRKEFFRKNYSYAKFSNSELITQSGAYSYPLRWDLPEAGDGEFVFTRTDDFDHLTYRVDDINSIVISVPSLTLLNILVTFTYVFVFFYLLLTISLLLVNIPFLKESTRLNIKNKIQYSMILVLLTSLLLIGSVTIFFSISQYKQRHNGSLREKIQSVYIEVMHKLEFEEDLTGGWQSASYASLDDLLKKFSNVFYTDINLYGPQGEIIATSRSEIFEKNLIGPRIHPKAYYELVFKNRAEFVQQEQIGSLEYLSAYVPFKNVDNKLLAYLNLPYFTKQEELTAEITNLVVAVMNFYVLFISLSVLVAVVISGQITQPLRMIQSKFGKLILGKSNEKIQYDADDEIGNLVREYNHMVDELAGSADKLAKSERESAWREMAKQIAHEIKNPLTPMKLSIQHLQKSWNKDPDNQEQTIQRITKTLIEQIDHLSSIATEFSNFAKMPRAINEEVDLKGIIQSIAQLFLNTERISIETDYRVSSPVIVFIDKEQLSRVLINLVKNAIQSIPEERRGRIGISLEATDKKAFIRVMDNGRGIPDELADKLFQPNFTTKSSGMGMGLAITRNIINNAGGSIHYETSLGEGTTFIIEIPLYQKNNILSF